MSTINIFSIPGSPFLGSVLFAMEECSAPYTFSPWQPQELKKEGHLKLHPFGRMPVVEHNGFTLYETQAILRYITDVFPGESLVPSDVQRRARMNQLIGINDWYLFPKYAAVAVWERLMKPRFTDQLADEAAIQGVMPMGRTCFQEIAKILGGSPYFTGDTFSLADIHLAPQLHYVAMTPEGQELFREYENLSRWLDRMRDRPAMKKTMLFGV
jgi:glutathione S-transferase